MTGEARPLDLIIAAALDEYDTHIVYGQPWSEEGFSAAVMIAAGLAAEAERERVAAYVSRAAEAKREQAEAWFSSDALTADAWDEVAGWCRDDTIWNPTDDEERPRPRCVHHGMEACPACSANPGSCGDPDAAQVGCGHYAATGMHWDTCPNRQEAAR